MYYIDIIFSMQVLEILSHLVVIVGVVLTVSLWFLRPILLQEALRAVDELKKQEWAEDFKTIPFSDLKEQLGFWAACKLRLVNYLIQCAAAAGDNYFKEKLKDIHKYKFI